MEDILVTFPTAKLAKEKGFIEYCIYAYFKDKEIRLSHCYSIKSDEAKPEDEIYAPTQSLLQKWLREIHEINCIAWCNASGWAWEIEKTNGTHISIMDIDGDVKGTNLNSGMFNIYEEALEIGLQEALKLIKL
jgi:hypothetical protein